MIIKLFKHTKGYLDKRPSTKKIVGIILIIIGFISFITPLTPGSWLIIIGLQLLGVNILLPEKFKFWKKK